MAVGCHVGTCSRDGKAITRSHHRGADMHSGHHSPMARAAASRDTSSGQGPRKRSGAPPQVAVLKSSRGTLAERQDKQVPLNPKP